MLSCWKYQQVPVCRCKKTFARGDFSSTCFVFIQSCIITLITVDAWYICCKRADSSHNRRIVRTFLRFIALHGTVVQLLKWEVKQFFCHCFYHSIPSISSRKSITMSWAGWVHCNTHKGGSGYCVEPPKRVFQSLWGCMNSIAPPWTTLVFTMMPCCLFTMDVLGRVLIVEYLVQFHILFWTRNTNTNSSPNVSTTPLRQWGFRQCLPFSLTALRGKHCRHPIAVMGVVDTFGHYNV